MVICSCKNIKESELRRMTQDGHTIYLRETCRSGKSCALWSECCKNLKKIYREIHSWDVPKNK